MVADLLIDHPPVGLDTEQHPSAPVVEHGAQGPCSFAPFAGGAFELQGLGLA
jgi:hypothetical protein